MRFIYNQKKEFPDMIRVTIYHNPRPVPDHYYNIKDYSKQEENYEPKISSLRRTRATVRDLVLANDFDLFATFTFDPNKIENRFSYSACWFKLQRWIHNQHIHSPNLKYLVIPEKHKNGAYHFHALLKNYNGNLSDSHHYTSSGNKVYNIKSYRSGFSTCCKIDNKEAVASYVLKYITKDFIREFDRRRFTCSRNLARPTSETNVKIDFTLPNRKVYSGDDFSIYEFTNSY